MFEKIGAKRLVVVCLPMSLQPLCVRSKILTTFYCFLTWIYIWKGKDHVSTALQQFHKAINMICIAARYMLKNVVMQN